jgi:hypothetical protein
MIIALLAALAGPPQDSLIADARRIITFFNTGHADSVQSRMTATAQQQRTAAQRDSVWHVLVGQVGPFQKFGRARVQDGPAGERTVDMEVFFQRQLAEALVSYDAEGRVSSVSFRFDAH